MFYLALSAHNASSTGAVCLLDSTDIRVLDNLTATVEVHRSFEITSEAGIRFSQVIIPINDFITVENINGYTELPGRSLARLTKDDVVTSAAPGYKGLGDIQAVTISLRPPTVGSKLYYEYKLVIKSLLYLPRITRRTDCPVKRLAVSLRWDKRVNINYDAAGVDIVTGKRQLNFTASDLPEIPNEPETCPDKLQISISSDIFNYDKGQYFSRSWADVGRFFALLSVQAPEVDSLLKLQSARLCVNSRSRDDTLSALFNFLADSVSYVALQMGKGDFTPHSCPAILSRRFGDCKDQSVLLSSLCRANGFDAYPALIYTGDYPAVDQLHPWPAWFDHVVTVVRDGDRELILDPSDPAATTTSIPPRLRGKSYLVCDGHSGLNTTPRGPDPAFGISWNFHFPEPDTGRLAVKFLLRYLGDAAAAYRDLWGRAGSENIGSIIQNQLRDYSSKISEANLVQIVDHPETLTVSGDFVIDFAADDSLSLPIPSPLNSYLLENLFADARKNDFCRSGSIRLEETVVIDRANSGSGGTPEFSDSWRRQGLSFSDELKFSGDQASYHRLLDFAGDVLGSADYNAFRDFLLSRREQQYVRLQN